MPPSLWTAMGEAPVIEMTVPLAARVAHIVETTPTSPPTPPRSIKALTRLPRHHAKASVTEWREMAARGEIAALAAALIEAHYDPAYRAPETRDRTGAGAGGADRSDGRRADGGGERRHDLDGPPRPDPSRVAPPP
jgi:tRNA 2-selenouridine synthase